MDGSVIIKAVLDTANIPKQVKELKNNLKSVSWDGIKQGDEAAQKLSSSLKGAGTACTIGLTAPIVASGVAAFNTASDYEQATARIQSALGLTAEEAEHLGDIGEDIYEGGFGPSLDAVSDALIIVRQNLGDLNDQDLAYVTQAALTLSDTLNMDVGETVRGVNALMDGFGLSAQDAMDLFVAGAQDGLNYSGELGDNLAEYGPRFAQMGFSAQEYFSILKTGAENGAYSLDKVNDFLNEFQTSLSDGRMDEQIGRFSESTQELFEAWKNGEATGKQVFEAVMGELAKMPDGYEKAQIASELWSSLGEDNALGMITSLAGVENQYGNVAGAAQNAANTASDSFANKAQSAMRELQGAIEPLGQPLLNIASNIAGCIQAFGEWFAGIGEGGQMAVLVLAGLLAAVGPVLSLAGNFVTVMPAITSALSDAGGAAGILSGALTALTGPIGIVIGVLAALTAAVVYLWNTNEGFRTAVTDAWNAIWTTIQTVISQLQPYIEQAWAAISNAVTQAMNVIMPIVSAGFQFIIAVAVPILQQLLQNVANVFQVILTTITGVMNGVAQYIQGVLTLIQGIFQTVLGLINGIVTGDFSMMQAGIQGIMTGIQNIILGAWNAIAALAVGAVNLVVTNIQNGLNSALSVVEGIFSGIQSTIGSAMDNASSIISGAIEAIKGFFNFRIEWPHIPMPHFSITPSGWQIGDLLKGSIPSLGIEWYAKGGVFNGPSVIGVGEAGPEAVVPLSSRRMQPFANAVAEGVAAALGGRLGTRSISQTYNFYQPIKSPDEVARAVRMSERYGLAAKQ